MIKECEIMCNNCKPATEYTKKFNENFSKKLNFSDSKDFEDAQRGFVLRLNEEDIKSQEDGHIMWALDAFDFEDIDKPCPDTVNPSLWRQSQLNHIHGLFKLCEGIYQVRGMDVSNITIIESKTGIILIDVLCASETARAGMSLYYAERGKRDIKAVLITHSHADHYGGIKGVVDEDDVISEKIPIIVPESFLFESISENAFVGTAMRRRAFYQYGSMLPKTPTGQVDTGIGKSVARGGDVNLPPPTQDIKEKFETHVIDGVTIEFMLTPGAEAPSEMVMYLPDFKVLCVAEEVNHTMHNVLTLRGAKVRDTRLWWKIIDDMINKWGDDVEIICASHHWPTWDHNRCLELLTMQRDGYKYMHDQCVRMINQGYNMVEIAEEFHLPPSIAAKWHMRGYYGSENHNCKAVYQHYLGWYDGNPSNLFTYTPKDGATRYVEMMGGADVMLKKLQGYYNNGDYRWVAEVGKHLIFSDPKNQAAAYLLADAFEQLGYQCENATWRNSFLTGAAELRMASTGKNLGIPISGDTLGTIYSMTDDMFFDYMTSRLNGPRAGDEYMTLNIFFTDRGSQHGLMLRNGVVLYNENKKYGDAATTIYIDRDRFTLVLLDLSDLDKEIDAGNAKIEGNKAKFQQFLDLLDRMTMDFNIVLP